MKKIILLICMLIFVTGCSSGGKEDGTKETGKTIEILETKSETPDVELKAESKEFALINITYANKSEKDYYTGKGWKYYYRKDDKSEWEELVPENYKVTQEGLAIKAGKDFNQELNLTEIFKGKELEKGEYKAENIVSAKEEQKKVEFTFKIQ
ncbi:membrane lipoprotein lipid attachment site-containing protein [Helcococcus kunzii]|uniref:Bacterial Ig-like domain-containing protein n=1 Tax=Helcococcus kunzii ATCC 51366 TaxID=883114 RepID=H3NL18_9FIRM|nr:membrane lipoprotein lipid attachment site-containing protein [Helcococcus kunzii]EHR36274.1 hypothetical protein HMPREF9709_00029 [Helcococcus kunzii ATCC 51366]MCT1797017.1 membrane lipoprotein lipid attachment site-containing protein [Helcococcus kunzii]MCT1988426.1 membrane lipoprotein lipid attachment site-containing protein [Helcococcus kunzii]QUY65718.1 hypothetical protein GUI37_09395 [Helcococcus kunzii]